jgi:hypothetical protein
LIIGGDGGVWPIAGAAAPKVKPLANAAPLFRKSLRAGRFESMRLSFSREYTPVRRSEAELIFGTGDQEIRSFPF